MNLERQSESHESRDASLAQEIQEILDHADEVVEFLDLEQAAERTEVVRERFSEALTKLSRKMANAVTMFSLSFMLPLLAVEQGRYHATRYKVSESVQQDQHLGSFKVFEHEDPETTQIINRMSLLNGTYYRLWDMEKKYGAPKIRWATKENALAMRNEGWFSQKRAWYDVRTNTMYLFLEPSLPAVDQFIAEMAHAKQSHERPLVSRWKRMKETIIATTVSRVWGEATPDQIHDTTYAIPGTVEHEAHKVIEPELKKEIGIRTDAS